MQKFGGGPVNHFSPQPFNPGVSLWAYSTNGRQWTYWKDSVCAFCIRLEKTGRTSSYHMAEDYKNSTTSNWRRHLMWLTVEAVGNVWCRIRWRCKTPVMTTTDDDDWWLMIDSVLFICLSVYLFICLFVWLFDWLTDLIWFDLIDDWWLMVMMMMMSV